jgi:creatinine amidohydrolase
MKSFLLLQIALLFAGYTFAQNIPVRWEEIVSGDFPKALEKSNRTCILPIGVLEEHGPQAPIGTDLIHVRSTANLAAEKEYAVIFPNYFYGEVNEARSQPGTFAPPGKIIWDALEAICDEIARNGFDKIVILTGRGGNPEFLHFFIQSLLNKRHNYVVYLYEAENDSAYTDEYSKIHKLNIKTDQQADESETSVMLYYTPELMRMDRAVDQTGAKQGRVPLTNLYTPILGYADYPNHYTGEGVKATTEFGKFISEHEIASFVKALKEVKADTKTLQLQNEFYDRVDNLNKQSTR